MAGSQATPDETQTDPIIVSSMFEYVVEGFDAPPAVTDAATEAAREVLGPASDHEKGGQVGTVTYRGSEVVDVNVGGGDGDDLGDLEPQREEQTRLGGDRPERQQTGREAAKPETDPEQATFEEGGVEQQSGFEEFENDEPGNHGGNAFSDGGDRLESLWSGSRGRKTTIWHVTPESNVEQIEQEGLQPRPLNGPTWLSIPDLEEAGLSPSNPDVHVLAKVEGAGGAEAALRITEGIYCTKRRRTMEVYAATSLHDVRAKMDKGERFALYKADVDVRRLTSDPESDISPGAPDAFVCVGAIEGPELVTIGVLDSPAGDFSWQTAGRGQ